MMKIWRIEDGGFEAGNRARLFDVVLREPANLLAAGGLVAFPTETVYGLGADARNEAAVKAIFQAKGRPSDNPLIVHIDSLTMLPLVTPFPEAITLPVRRAMEVFWPGSITILLPAHSNLAASVHPGTSLVGVRMPNHPVAQALIRLAGCPIAAPSANKSGRPSPTEASHVIADFDDDIAGVVDGGPCDGGLESTVVHIAADQVTVLRPGLITAEEIAEVTGLPVNGPSLHTSGSSNPPVMAPGMKYRHYAPDASVHVWWGDDANVKARMQAFIQRVHAEEGNAAARRVAVVSRNLAGLPHQPLCWTPELDEDYAVALSRALYGLLRAFDHANATHILIHGTPPVGIGAALMNRLEKAAEGRVWQV